MGIGDWPGGKSGQKKSFYIIPMFQVLGMCGPEKECCVGNQTLRDNNCLVPCTGLYADISDDSGTKLMIFNHMTCIRSPNTDTKAEPSVGGATS